MQIYINLLYINLYTILLYIVKMSEFTLVPIEGKGFVDRKGIIKEIVETLSDPGNNIGFALYGRRKVGKTSLLLEIKRQLKPERKVVVAYVSIWELVEETVEAFAEKLAMEILEGYRPILGIKHRIKSLVSSNIEIINDIMRDMSIGAKVSDDVEFFLKLNLVAKKNVSNLLEKSLNLGEKLAKETNTKCVIMIDEFPSIMKLKFLGSKVGIGVIKAMQNHYERQKYTALCISGSIRKTMELTVFSTSSAFYRQLIGKEILPLEEKYLKKIILQGIKKERITDDALSRIYGFSKGIPFYAQFIGKKLEGAKRITPKEVDVTIDDFLKNEGNLLFLGDFNQLSPKERVVVVAMAKDLYSPSKIAQDTQESITTVNTYLIYLEDKGIISKEERGVYRLSDPIFKMWLQLRFCEEG